MGDRVPLIVFDVGGTLIEDPFVAALDGLGSEIGAEPEAWQLAAAHVPRLFALWREENATTDYPFASHFLQEEVWPGRALLHLCAEGGGPPRSELPQLAARLLARYRDHARAVIGAQPDRVALRAVLDRAVARGACLGAASNDREICTHAMLAWADLIAPMRFVLTSEGLSRRHAGAEKPRVEFFRAVLDEVGGAWSSVVYVGDSERNDIVPAQRLGWVTIRRIVRSATPSKWLDTTIATAATHAYETTVELATALDCAIDSAL